MKLIKKVIGVDISKDSLTVRFGTLDENLNQKISKPYTFKNNDKGFNQILKIIDKVDYFKISDNSSEDIPIWFVMEATGVYYEHLAYFLAKKQFSIFIVLPNKVKNFSRTLDNKSKTDDIDAAIQTQYGLEKKLKPWNPPQKFSKNSKSLQENINQSKNQLAA